MAMTTTTVLAAVSRSGVREAMSERRSLRRSQQMSVPARIRSSGLRTPRAPPRRAPPLSRRHQRAERNCADTIGTTVSGGFQLEGLVGH